MRFCKRKFHWWHYLTQGWKCPLSRQDATALFCTFVCMRFRLVDHNLTNAVQTFMYNILQLKCRPTVALRRKSFSSFSDLVLPSPSTTSNLPFRSTARAEIMWRRRPWNDFSSSVTHTLIGRTSAAWTSHRPGPSTAWTRSLWVYEPIWKRYDE